MASVARGVAHERIEAQFHVALATVPDAAVLRIDADGFQVRHHAAAALVGFLGRIGGAVRLQQHGHAAQLHRLEGVRVVLQARAVIAGRVVLRAVVADHHPLFAGGVVVDAGQAANHSVLKLLAPRQPLFADEAQAGDGVRRRRLMRNERRAGGERQRAGESGDGFFHKAGMVSPLGHPVRERIGITSPCGHAGSVFDQFIFGQPFLGRILPKAAAG